MEWSLGLIQFLPKKVQNCFKRKYGKDYPFFIYFVPLPEISSVSLWGSLPGSLPVSLSSVPVLPQHHTASITVAAQSQNWVVWLLNFILPFKIILVFLCHLLIWILDSICLYPKKYSCWNFDRNALSL